MRRGAVKLARAVRGSRPREVVAQKSRSALAAAALIGHSVRGNVASGGVLVFDPDAFVSECQRAASAPDSLAAVHWSWQLPLVIMPRSARCSDGFKGESDTLFSSAEPDGSTHSMATGIQQRSA